MKSTHRAYKPAHKRYIKTLQYTGCFHSGISRCRADESFKHLLPPSQRNSNPDWTMITSGLTLHITESHKGPEGGRNVGPPSLFWHSAQPERQELPTLRVRPHFTPKGNISLKGWVDTRDTKCGQQDQFTWKFPGNPVRIERGASRFAAQFLNELRHRSTPVHGDKTVYGPWN